ncbi:MAG: TrmB family transcriptional regulator [Saccharofermentanales bacterium]
MMDLAERLCEFNLTRQEAAVYLLLCANPVSTGYEIAKLAGISRSNTYAALSSLADKGAARLIEGLPSRYTAVPADEFCGNRIRTLMAHKKCLEKNIPIEPHNSEGYMTVQGERNIIDTAVTMVRNSAQRVYLSLSGKILEFVEEDLRKLILEGKKIVLITNPPYSLPGATVYHAAKTGSQIRIIVDSQIVLTGDLDEGNDSTCLYSKKQNLVDIFKESLQNEIRLIEVLNKDPKTAQ